MSPARRGRPGREAGGPCASAAPARRTYWLVAALYILSAPGLAVAEPQFGRLFTTSEQRQRLQALRAEHSWPASNRDQAATPDGPRAAARRDAPSHQPHPNPPPRPAITLKGLIYKKDEARMAWIKDRGGTLSLDYQTLQPGQTPDDEFTVRLPGAGKSVKLKPGQSWHPDSGTVTELEGHAP